MKYPAIPISWRRISQLISQYEKVLLAILSIVIVISGTFWYRQFSQTQTDQPTTGGTYVEGVVGSRAEVEAIAAKITRAGLFTLNDQGALENLLVEDWGANDDYTEYHFTLREGVEANEIRDSLEQNGEVIDQAAVSLEGRELKLTLPAANPNLPLILTQPFFDYGPYKVSKITNKTTILTRNTRTHAVVPYINKVIIHTFENESALKEALSKHQVDGGVIGDAGFSANNISAHDVSLPLYYVVIANFNQVPFREADFRRQVFAAQGSSSKAFRLTVADSEPYLGLANSLVEQWRQAGFQVTLDARPLEEIQQKVAPSRDFQLLLTGVSYGSELDPYYLWHSTQIRPPGNNLAGVKSDKIDGLINQIRSSPNAAVRQGLITALHQDLKDEAVAMVLKQETSHFFLSNNIHFSQPYLPISATDHWQSIARWWAR